MSLTSSGVYLMLFKGQFAGDCTVGVDPDGHLGSIAQNTATVAEQFGDTPKVAMLSYSDFGEDRGFPDVDKVTQAVSIFMRPADLIVGGGIRADTAVNRARAESVFPFGQIAGDANVLVFPNLAAGNIAYKLLRELGGATAVDPSWWDCPIP